MGDLVAGQVPAVGVDAVYVEASSSCWDGDDGGETLS